MIGFSSLKINKYGYIIARIDNNSIDKCIKIYNIRNENLDL